MCDQETLKSACACAQSDQSLPFSRIESLNPKPGKLRCGNEHSDYTGRRLISSIYITHLVHFSGDLTLTLLAGDQSWPFFITFFISCNRNIVSSDSTSLIE